MSHADMTTGFLIGLFVAGLMAVVIRDHGRSACEDPLPRTQKCIQVWVPEKPPKEGAT